MIRGEFLLGSMQGYLNKT